jgi:subtilisin family serine protease
MTYNNLKINIMKNFIFILLSSISFLAISQNVQYYDELGNSISIGESEPNEFVKGEIIVKFKKGFLSSTFHENEAIKTNVTSAKNNAAAVNERSFFKDYANYYITKLVTKYKPSYGKSTARNGQIVDVFNFENLVVLYIPFEEDVLKLINRLKEYEEIEYAEPNYLMTFSDSPPNDPDYIYQRGFEQPSDADIDANRAWDFTTGNYAVKVGVIDNGIDYDNFDLGNGAFGVNGAVVRGGWDYYNNDADPDDNDNGNDSHGTPVAGVIGALRNNGQMVAGLAGGNGGQPGVQLFALKAGRGSTTKTSHSINAIFEAAADTPNFGFGIHILNASWGSYTYKTALREAISWAAANGVIFVAAKGNDSSNSLHYPSDYSDSEVISVGGTDNLDFKHPNSNFGNNMDVTAPYFVRTTVLGQFGVRTTRGTSVSAPAVSGLAALILSEAIEQNLSITLHPQDVENIIELSSEDVNGGGYDDQLGHGRINAGRALEMMNQPWELEHHQANGGNIVHSTGFYNTIFLGYGSLASGVYTVKRHEVQRTVNLPFFTNQSHVWGRGAGASTGWSAASPNTQVGFCDVASFNNNTATLRTYVYEIFSVTGANLGWYPSRPQNVVYAYTTLGAKCPSDRNIFEPIQEGTISEQLLFSAGNNIVASNLIGSNTDVIYSAGNQIKLIPGFIASGGSNFTVQIAPCAQSRTSTTYSSKKSSNSIVSNNQKGQESSNFSDNQMNALELFPNPTSSEFNIVSNSKLIEEYIIYDVTGKQIQTNNGIGFKEVKVSVAEFKQGIYFVHIKLENGQSEVLKFIKN